MKAIPALLLAAAIAAAVTGCESTGSTPDPAEALGSPDKPLSFPVPASRPGSGSSGKWTAVPRDGGAEYAQVLGDMEDVVSFYGFWSAVAPEIRTFEDMATFLQNDATFGFQHLQRGTVRGVPVLWFEKRSTEKGEGSISLAKLLNARPRQPGETYQVRTRGVFMFQPGRDPKFVTIACSRTSSHGEIGTLYESQFMDWLGRIIDTCFL